MRRAILLVAFGAVGVLSLVACSGGGALGGGSDPTSTASTPTDASLPGFDACTVLSDQQLTTLGENPRTKKKADLGSGLVTKGCTWNGSIYDLTLSTAHHQVSDYSDKPKFTKVTLSGRQAATIVADNTGTGCTLVVHAGIGVVLVQIDNEFGKDAQAGDPCKRAVNIGNQLAPDLPK